MFVFFGAIHRNNKVNLIVEFVILVLVPPSADTILSFCCSEIFKTSNILFYSFTNIIGRTSSNIIESSTEDNVLSVDDSAAFCPDEDEMDSASCPSLEVEENAPTTASTSRLQTPGPTTLN